MIGLNNFRVFWMHWYKMMIGIELIRYQTKYRPKEHQKLPSKKPFCAIIELIHCYVSTIFNTLNVELVPILPTSSGPEDVNK